MLSFIELDDSVLYCQHIIVGTSIIFIFNSEALKFLFLLYHGQKFCSIREAYF